MDYKVSDDFYNKYLKKKKEEEEKLTPADYGVKSDYSVSSDFMDAWKSGTLNNKKDSGGIDLTGWFQKGAFEDGFDWSDIPKAILGTAEDAVGDLTAGILGMPEKAIDAVATGHSIWTDIVGLDGVSKKLSNFAARDLYDENAIAKGMVNASLMPNVLKWMGAEDEEAVSVLGEKTDSTVQSGGQMLATAALQAAGVPWQVTTAVMSYGTEAEQAFRGGATPLEAGISSAVSAGSEVLFESLSGGISFGGKTMDDAITKRIARTVSNKAVRTLLKFGVDFTGEGIEEILTGFFSSIGQKLTYAKEKDWAELFSTQEAFDSFVGGALMGGVGSGVTAVKGKISGVDPVSGLVADEETVVKKATDALIAEREQKYGRKLTNKEKDAAWAEVTENLEHGGLDIDSIAEFLGGESYEAFKAESDSFFGSDAYKAFEEADRNEKLLPELQEKYDKLHAIMPEKKTGAQQNEEASLLEKIQAINNAPKSSDLKAKLDPVANKRLVESYQKMHKDAFARAKNSRLAESYLEHERSQQKLDIDISKYTDENARKTVQAIIDSGLGDNSNGFKRFVDFMAKIAADKKTISFDLTDNKRLFGTEHSRTGLRTNGYKLTDENGTTIVINKDAANPLRVVVGHEFTHALEGTEFYDAIADSVLKFAETKEGKANLDARIQEATRIYKDDKNTTPEKEVVADLIGEYVFTDYEFVMNLANTNHKGFMKLFDEVKYLTRIAVAGSKEARELAKVKNNFERAYREFNVGEQKNTANESGVQHSLRRDIVDVNGKEYDSVVELDKSVSQRVLSEPKRLLNYIKQNFVGLKIPVLDENGNTEIIEFAGEKETTAKKGKGGKRNPVLGELAHTTGDTRKQVVVNAIEVIQESVYDPVNSTPESEHGWLDEKGWESRKTYVLAKDGNIYEAYLRIAKARDGRNILYGVNLDIDNGIAVDESATQKRAAVIAAMPSDGKVAQPDKKVKTQHSFTKDSDGKELTKAQTAFFKDSKIVDEDGNLKVMYHGSPETFTVFDRKKAKSSGYYGKGFYFTDSESHAGQYGNKYEVYLNITNPLQDGTNDITKEQLRKFVEAIADNEDYGIDNYGYGATVDGVTDAVYGKSDFAMLMDINASCVGNMVEAIELFNEVNGTDYNGIIAPTETVAFYPNQIKSVTNSSPTADPDIRFSLSKAVEETKDLMALHNLSDDKLMKSLKLGGLPMPSVAIAKGQDGHDNFGNITLILNKDSIDPQMDRRNKLYSGDAWTPMYPSVEYKVDRDVLDKVESKVYGLVPESVMHDLSRIGLDVTNMTDTLNRYGGNVVEAFKNDYGLKYAYLLEAEADIELPMKEKNISYYGSRENGAIIRVAEAISADEITQALNSRNREGYDKLEPIVRKAASEYVEETYGSDPELMKLMMPDGELSFSELDGYLTEARSYHRKGVEQTVDTKAARQLIDDMTVQYSYEEWLENLFDGIVEKEGIRNNKDYFTPSGNRRSFEALHYEHNLENVIKAMREQGEKGIGNGFGGANIFGASTTAFSSVEDMKQSSDRLQSMSYDEYQEIRKGFMDRFYELAGSLPNETGSFSVMDSAAEVLTEAVAKYNTRSGIANYLKRELKGWATYSEQVVDDLIELVNDIRKMPTGYFEAKPQRAVGFDEVAVFVIPRNANIKLKQELLSRGYNIAEYDPDVEGDRQKVVNRFEEYKFSLTPEGTEQSAESKFLKYTRGAGRRTTFADRLADLAPIREDIAPAVAPETVSKTETVDDMFSDDLPSIDEELDNLLQQKEALESRMQEALNNEDYDAFAKVNDEYNSLMARLEELEQEATDMDADRLSSLDDADVPPVRENEWLDRADVVPLTKKAAQDIARDVRQKLDISNKHMYDVRMLIEEYSQSEFPDREQLFRDIKEKFGTYSETVTDDFVKEARHYLRTVGVAVDDSIKSEIADYANLMRRNRGRILFKKDGLPVDVMYQELHSNFPGLFPETIYSPTDQFEQMVEVANMDAEHKHEQELPDEAIWDVVDAITDGVSKYQQTQKEKTANKYGREGFNSLMRDADQYVPPVDLDRVLANRRKPMGTDNPDAPVVEIYDTNHKKGVAEGQQAMWDDPVPETITRSVLHERIVNDAKAKFAVEGFDLDDVLKNAKNLPTFATVDNTPQRVMEKALGYKEGGVLADLTVNKVAQNETEGIKWLNSYTDRKTGLLAQISKQYNIKPGSKESAAAQMYGEGFYVNENDEIIQYGDAELAKDFPDAKVRANIKALARDPRVRQIYDETLAKINESRTRNAYPEIPRLDNYYLHFRAMEDTFSKLGLPFNPNDIRAKDLPTDLNGVTADLKPGQPYFASAMHRTGRRTSFDLLGGLEKYLTSAKNQIYHIDDIQTLRALRNYIADTYGQASGLEGLDALSEEEQQERIEQVYGSHLSTFAKFLNEEANVLAGKTALIDRGLEGIIGRRGITFLETINQQVGKNMVGFNVSSSMTNILPVVQTIAKTNKFDFLKAFAQTASNKVGSIFGRSDGFAESSPVIIRRKGAESFYRTPWQKVGDAGYFLMSAVDNMSTELITRTKYNELTRKGVNPKQAHYETDKWVSRLMGDRSLGQQPQLYNSKMLGLITKFQLEVRNQLDAQFYDTIQEANTSTEDIKNGLLRNAAKAAKVGSTFFQLAVLQHLFGKAFESVAGYNPAFDIIDVLVKAFGFDDDEEDEDTVLDNIEEGFFALLEDLPYTSTLTGGRIPISAALPVTELIKGEDQYGNEKSRWETLGEIAPYYLLPGGYGQIKKTQQGLAMFDDDLPVAGSYTDSGNLRYPVEDTPLNRIQAGLFGQYASENARYYFDNEIAPLNDKQIQEYKDVDIPIRDYWEYREGLKGKETLGEKLAYISKLDLPFRKQNILANNLSDRKEPIDMADWDKYDGLEEYNYAKKYPEKYNFLEANGITVEEYNNFDDDTKEAYSWAYQNPEKYTLSKAVASDLMTYRKYASDLSDLKADKDEDGKSISGSRKEKVIAYINNMDAEYGEKLILFKSEYPSDDTYNMEIVEYLNSRDDISYEDEVTILKELGFTVLDDGTVYWD